MRSRSSWTSFSCRRYRSRMPGSFILVQRNTYNVQRETYSVKRKASCNMCETLAASSFVRLRLVRGIVARWLSIVNNLYAAIQSHLPSSYRSSEEGLGGAWGGPTASPKPHL